jgi:hypothetical protein
VLTAVSGLVIFILLFRILREKRGRLATFALLWFGVYGLFFSTWEPATLCYRMTDVIPLGILLALGLKTLKISVQAPFLAVLLASLLTVNLADRIIPMGRPEKNLSYQEVLALSKISTPDSLYLTEGGYPWMYLLYFTGRTAWNRRSLDPRRLEEVISRQKKIRPVYIQKGRLWEQVR